MQFWEWFGKVLLITVAATAVKLSEDGCWVREDLANCSAVHLTYIPHDLPHTIQLLDASQNHLNSLHWPLPYLNLVNLNLSRNNIHLVSYLSLNNLISLAVLDLSFNNIKFLSQLDSNFTFLQTPQLVKLILKGNPLKSLNSDPIRSDSLRRIDLADCDIRHLQGDISLLWLPNLLSLVLDRNPLIKVDQIISTNLEELYLVETQLRYVQPEVYVQLPRLRILDLSKNFYLNSLSRTGSANSTSLKILRAEFCSLEYLQIRGLPRLEQLHLKGNRIDKIERGDFISSGRLITVDLSMNWIHQIDHSSFIGASNLAWMDLSGNRVNDLESYLSALPRLTYLNISNNPLKTIEGVEAAPFLRVFDASHCEISSFPSGLLHLGQLEAINLSRNALQSLPSGMTSFTLIEFDLGYNRLTVVEDDWFKHFPRMKNLRLEGNRLTEPFHPDTLKRLGHVRLHLDDNPWRCDCKESRYKLFYTHLVAKGNLQTLTCHGPESVNGLSWKNACFSTDAEASVKRTNKNAWLPMLVAALATLGIIVLLYLLRRHNNSQRSPETSPEVQRTPRSAPRDEAPLPSYEEALLMPKPTPRLSKSHADTQTTATFLGSARSLDTRNKNSLPHSPSSNSL